MTVSTLYASTLSTFLSPLFGWLADVKFGRYKLIKLALYSACIESIVYFLTIVFAYQGTSTLKEVFYTIAIIFIVFSNSLFIPAMLPFLTDQLIGATSDELITVVRWYFWLYSVSAGLSDTVTFLHPDYGSVLNADREYIWITGILAVPFVAICMIISDCLCQQWLDRTHKVTNPIKLIIQVLNYTRKHRYPERRSAFTYIDEEQPTRMDYGKEKFGGPFTEEEVEDVKTVLRLLPIVICLSVIVGIGVTSVNFLEKDEWPFGYGWLNDGMQSWILPLLLIPCYRFLVHPLIHKHIPSLLKCIGTGLFMLTLGYILLEGIRIRDIVVSNNTQQYIYCTPTITVGIWYWKIGPFLLYGVGSAVVNLLLFELIIAQSPDKMKGLTFGVFLAFQSLGIFIISSMFIYYDVRSTLCYSATTSLLLVVLFVVFLVLSKRYTLRERNREINIQAIVEEHYERYMDQEEEYMRQQHY